MANSDKNIRIHPNRSSTLFPKITFTGQSNNPIILNVLDDNSISFEGSAGQLFSINNNLSSGYIFSVNDISGLPSFRINADGTVGIAEFYGNVGIGITNPSYKFHARGDSYFSSTGNTALLLLSGTGGTIIASNSVNITLTDPARKGLVISAATSQSANLLEWYASLNGVGANALAGTIRPTGQVHLGSPGYLTMSNGGSALLGLQGRGTSEGLAIRGYNSNSNNPLFEVQGNPGNQLFGIYGDGGVNAPRINVTNGTASTSTTSGALTVAGGVGIGGTLNARSVYVNNDLMHIPGTGNTFGMSFTSFTLPTGFTGSGLYAIYAENKFVATGGSVVAYSNDLINWTTSYIPWNASVGSQSITYGNGIYVVTSTTNSYVAYSRDLSTWTLAGVQYQNYATAAYGNGRFVINAGSVVGISTNGANWLSLAPTGSGPNGGALKFQNGYFYSSSSRSVDGIAWEPLNISISVGNISYGNGLYFGAQYNSSNYAYSYDGVNFTAATIANNVYLGTDYHNGVYYLRTQHNNAILYYSTDGLNYQGIGFGGVGQYAMAFGKNKIVIFGRDGGSGVFGYYAEGTNGKIDLNPIREGNIDNTVIGSRTPKPANFTDLSATGYVNIVNQAGSASKTSGALVVRGGVGIGGSLFVGNTLSVASSTASTSTTSGALIVTGGVGIGGTLNANSVVTYNRLQNQSFSGASVGASDGRMGNYSSIGGHDRILFGNGTYVTNSSWGAYNAAYSTDGANWIVSSLPVNQGYPVNIFGNGYFVLAATGATTVLYSTNGISWSQVSIGNTQVRTTGAYGNGKYVIVGTGSTFNYSNNLTTWITGTLPLTGDWRMAYGNGIFVAIGYGTNKLIYSYDGINWSIGNVDILNKNFTKVTYTNGKFIVTSFSSGGSYYSIDGINWFGTNAPGGDVVNVAYGNGVYFLHDAIAYATSIDGINWGSMISFKAGYESFMSTYGLNKFNTGGRWIDGPTNTVTLDPKFTGEINNVRIGALTPASGDFTNLSSIGNANLVGTVNANNLNILSKINQTPVLGGFAGTTGWTTANLLVTPVQALAFGNGLFVSIRKGTNSTSFSSDGKKWTASNMPFVGQWNDVAWGVDKFVAVAGVGTSGAFSGNGISWSSMNMPATAQGWYAVTYGVDKFVSVGNTSTAAYSSDGITWSGSSIANTNWTGVAYGNGTFVAVSGFGLSGAYSYDGINWNLINLPTNGGNGIKFITYGNGYFIVTNYVSTAINYSRDGINWSTSTRYSTANIHTDLAYGNGIYSIFNYSETSYSYDAINWLNGNTIASTDWQAVAYGNNRFVATSINTGQVGSIDGPSNTLNLYPKFTGDIDNVRIGAKQPGAAEFTNLAAQQPVRFTANTPSNDSTSGALVVLGGVGIGGSINIGGRVGIGTYLLDATLNIRTSTASTPGIVIQGSTSQSASLFRVNSSVGGSFFEITNSGIVNIKTSTVGDFNSVPLQRWYGDGNSIVGVFQKGGFLYTGNGLGYVDGAGSQTLVHQWVPNGSYYITNWSKRMANGTQIMFASSAGGDVRIYGDTNGSLTFQSFGTYTNNTMVKLMDPSAGTNQALLGVVSLGYTRSQLFSYGNLALNMTIAGSAGTDWDTTNLFRANVNTKTKYLGNLAILAVDNINRFVVGPNGNTTVALGGTTTSTGFIIKAAVSQIGNLFETQSSTGATITFIDASGNTSIGGSVTINSLSQSTSTTNGSLKVSGGVGISGNVNVGGSVNFSSSIFGGVSTSIVPTMTFIGQANDPITLSVLSDNSLSFDGSSGQLFSINNNLSTGWIFSISDISGLPLFRTNADGTVSMGEFGGNVGIGLTNPTYKLQVAGNAGIANTLFVSGRANIGNTSFTDIYGSSYNPIITATDTFDDDIVIQIENKSDGVNARAGLLFKNNTNSVAQLYLSGENYGGAGLGFSEIRLLGDYPFIIDTKSTSIRASSSEVVNFDSTKMTVIANAESTSSSTGSLVVNGGAGIAKSLNVGGYLSSKPAYATAGLAATQTLTSGADNLILFTDNSDPNAWWTSVAGSGVSHRFKPNIAGLYFVSAQVHFLQGTGSGQMYIQARKNGNTFSLSRAEVVTNANGLTLNLSGTTSLDGNTDYIDFAVFTAGTQNIHGEANRAWSQSTIYKIF